MTIRLVLFVAACSLLMRPAHTDAQQLPADLQEAIRGREEARVKKDVATWDRLTTADFTLVDEEGRMMKKAERLTELKGVKPEAPSKPQEQQFTRHGDTVILREKQQDGTWAISIWVKDAKVWRVAAVQITAIAKK